MYHCTMQLKILNVSLLVSATLEGPGSQLRALFLQILLSYQILQPLTFMNIITAVYILMY